MHGDLHKRNILVTPEDRVIILDFEGSETEANPEDMAVEMRDMTSLQAKRVSSNAKTFINGSYTAQLIS